MPTDFERGMARNTRLTCSSPGCALPRYSINLWCRPCTRLALRYGDPKAKAIRSKQWSHEVTEVKALFASNCDHPGYLQVLKVLKVWMDTATQSDSAYKGAQEIARLSRGGVTPEGLLTALAGFWMFTSRPEAKGYLPTQKAIDTGISRAVFGLVPRMRRITGTSKGATKLSGTWGVPLTNLNSYTSKPRSSALSHIGRYLRETFAVFLANVEQGVLQQRQLKVDPLALHRVPFKVTQPKKVKEGLPFPPQGS